MNRRFRIATAVLVGLLLFAIALAPRPAWASYRPIPRQYLAAALDQAHVPAAHTTAKRAWVVCQVFGRYRCHAALDVFWCESSLRPWAANGQYRGIPQFGAWARARYGWGRTTWQQARAALRYWRDAHWTPWQCKPWSWM